MEYIEWNDDLSVGVNKFDEEHRHLIKFINNLNQALQAGGATKTMEDILTGLIKYTVIHFRHEEDYMKIYDYPDYENHKKEHDKLTAEVSDFYERLRAGKSSFTIELLGFLRDWLTSHIMVSDKAYREFFKSRGA